MIRSLVQFVFEPRCRLCGLRRSKHGTLPCMYFQTEDPSEKRRYKYERSLKIFRARHAKGRGA